MNVNRIITILIISGGLCGIGWGLYKIYGLGVAVLVASSLLFAIGCLRAMALPEKVKK